MNWFTDGELAGWLLCYPIRFMVIIGGCQITYWHMGAAWLSETAEWYMWAELSYES